MAPERREQVVGQQDIDITEADAEDRKGIEEGGTMVAFDGSLPAK